MRRVGSPTDILTLRLVSGAPGGSLLSTSYDIDGSAIGTSYEEVEFVLDNIETLTGFDYLLPRDPAERSGIRNELLGDRRLREFGRFVRYEIHLQRGMVRGHRSRSKREHSRDSLRP